MSDAFPTDIAIRLASPPDAGAISALIDALAHHFLLDPADRASAAPFFATIAPETIAATIEEGRVRYHLAEGPAGDLLGAVGIRDGSHLYHLFVAEHAHRRGIAGRLWDVARRDAVGRGTPGRFTVNSSIVAIPLYERFGFRPVGERREQDGISFLPMELSTTDGEPAV